MALVFIEGFDEYGTTASTFIPEVISAFPNNGYGWVHSTASTAYINATTSVVRTNAGVNGKSLATDNNQYLTAKLNDPTEIILGFAFYTTYTAGSSFLCYLLGAVPASYLSHGATGIRLTRMTDGSLVVVNNSNSATLGTSAVGILPANAWNYIELRYKFDSSGDIQVRVNGTEVINLSGIDTRGAATALSYYSVRGPASGLIYYDDIYICDTTGTTNNTFLGPIGVYTLMPSADNSVQMSPSSGANYSCVNEAPANGSTSYVTATSSTLTDFYAVDNLPVAISPTAIAGVQVKARSMKPENNNGGLQLGVKADGVSSFGTAKTVLTSSWTSNFSIFETKPAGGAWDKTSIDAMDVGILST